jgi:hypothetical protein
MYESMLVKIFKTSMDLISSKKFVSKVIRKVMRGDTQCFYHPLWTCYENQKLQIFNFHVVILFTIDINQIIFLNIFGYSKSIDFFKACDLGDIIYLFWVVAS